MIMKLLLGLLTLQLLTPAEIDPSDPSAGDFLDADLTAYRTTADEAYRNGNWNLAIRYYLAALSSDIHDEITIYNVACCYALLEEVELASLYLQRAVIAGYNDLEFMRSDPDFDGIREDPLFIGTMEHIAAALFEPPEYSGIQLDLANPAVFPCLVQLPPNYDPYYDYTLLVGLHGYGDSPENFIRLWEYFLEPDFIYACPRAPYPFMENNMTGYSWFLPNREDIGRLDAVSVDYVESVVEALKAKYSVGEVFLFGFSQGCGLSLLSGIRKPDEFAGIIGFGGRLHETFLDSTEAGDLAETNFFIANGTLDEGADVTEGRTTTEALRELGADVHFETWNGYHLVNREVLRSAAAWMDSLASM